MKLTINDSEVVGDPIEFQNLQIGDVFRFIHATCDGNVSSAIRNADPRIKVGEDAWIQFGHCPSPCGLCTLRDSLCELESRVQMLDAEVIISRLGS